MERFLTRHASRISGILSGFDRLLFRGQVLSISFVDGMDRFLSSQRILYKDFGAFAQQISDRVKRHAETIALQAGRPFEYLASPQVRKDERAVAIAEAQGIQEGLVCVFSCVEPCQSFTIRRDPAGKRLRLVAGERKCLYVYFYFLDPEFSPHACPVADVAAADDPGLRERPRVAGAAADPRRDFLHATGQLFHRARRRAAGASAGR